MTQTNCDILENMAKEHERLFPKATAKAQIRSCDLEIINAQLKEQLTIAREALKCYEQENWTYADEYNYFPLNEYTGGWCHAEKALEQIKELEK